MCGFGEIRTDEVVAGEVIFLAECPRCEFRWTSKQPIFATPVRFESMATMGFQRVPAQVVRQVLPAA